MKGQSMYNQRVTTEFWRIVCSNYTIEEIEFYQRLPQVLEDDGA